MSRREKIDPDMPWGWWLIRDGDKVRDDDGRTWPSLTKALKDHLWPKLGWQDAPRHSVDVLLRTLEVLDEHGKFDTAAIEQLFAGNRDWADWFEAWLVEVGLAREGDRHFIHFALTDLGRSVLLMLKHVSSEERHTLSMREIRMETGAQSAVSERALARVEEIQNKWPPKANKVFRDTAGSQFVIKFSHFDRFSKDSGGMPISRVVWSMSFRDEALRDQFYAWMCEHSFHWDQWGTLAEHRGARALSERLLTIRIQEQAGFEAA